MMKIVHCIFTMETGGAQMLVVDMLNNLCNNHDTSLIIVNNEFNESIISKIDSRVSVYYLNRKQGSKSLIPLVRLNKFINKIKPDVIHCHEPNMANFILLNKYYKILTVHDTGKIVPNYRKYNAFTAISKAVAVDFKKRYGIDAKIVHNGIEFDFFTRKALRDLNPKSTFKVVQVSRLIHQKKGQDILIQAVHTLVYKYNLKNIELYFVGDGASLPTLQKMAEALGLSNYVTFLGNKSRTWLADNLRTFDLLVQPSRYEGFGLTVLEGIAAGLPVLASDIEGPAEILSLSPMNMLFKSEDAEECTNKILSIQSNYQSNDFINDLETTYELIKEKYSLQSMVDSLLQVYKKEAV